MNGATSNTSGENQAKFRMKPAAEGDRLPQSVVEEFQRRGYVVIDITAESNIVIQPLEPEDKTKVWFVADANGIPQGSAKVYNSLTGKWGPADQGIAPYVPPATRFGKLSVDTGATTKTINFESVGSNNWHLSGHFSTYNEGIYDAAPATTPLVSSSTLAWILSGKGENSATIDFYGVPSAGLTFEWKVEAIPQ